MKEKMHKSTVNFSKIIWGTWQGAESVQETKDLIEYCLSLGITTFDSADIYGGYQKEEIVGKALKELDLKREDFQIITKANIMYQHPDFPESHLKNPLSAHYNSSYEHLTHSINRSLEKLQLDYIDVFLLHRLDYLMNPKETAKAFNEAYKKGYIKSLGVSNQPTWQLNILQKYLDIPIVTNQIEFSLHQYQALDDGSLAQAIEKEFKPMYWSPFGQGKIFQNPKLVEKLESLAKEYQVSSTNTIALAWILKHPAGGFPVIGTNNKERIKASLEALDINLSNVHWYDLLATAGKHLP